MTGARRRVAVDLGVLAAVWAFVAQLALAPWARHPGFDDLTYSAPNQRLTLHELLHFRVPLWNPFIFGGTPHLGNVQTAVMYPGNLVAAPFPDLLGASIELALHLALIGVGWWWLGRRLGLARSATLVMGVLAMATGATVARLGLLVHLPPLAWAPIAMVGLLAVARSARPWRAVAFTAVAMWLVVVSGHPQSILMAGVLLLAWAVGVLIDVRNPRRALHIAAAGALAACMAAPMLLAARASIHAAAAASRGLDSLRTPGFFTHPTQVAQLFLGRPLSGSATGLLGEGVTYVGAVAAALAVLGLVAAVRRRAAAPVAVALAGLFGFGMSFGLRSPVFRAARRWLPGFDQPRVSIRWTWVAAMAVVLLAGLGVDALSRARVRTDAGWIVAAMALVAGSAAFGVVFGGAATAVLWLAGAGAVAAAVWLPDGSGRRAALVVAGAVMVFELAVPVVQIARAPGTPLNDATSLVGDAPRWLAQHPGLSLAIVDERYQPRYLVGGMRPNANVLADVRSIDGYDGGVAVSRRWIAALHQFLPYTNDLTFRAQLAGELWPDRMARLGVHYVLYDPSRGPADAVLAGWQQVAVDDDFQIWENPQWKGDTVAWYDTRVVADAVTAGDTIREEFDQLGVTALVESAVDVHCTADCAPTAVTSTSSLPGRRTATVTARHDAVVSFTEQFDEGWTATIDGRDATVVPVDGVWAGVVVPAGTHTIALRYAPRWWWPSVALCLLGVLGTAVLAATPTLARRRDRLRAARSAAADHG